MRENMRWEGLGRFRLLGEGLRPRGTLRWGGRRARFLHFEFAELQGQRDPLLGQSFEFLIGGELLAHLRNKRRTNELGGALAAVRVTQLVEGAMFLRPDRIHTFTTAFLAGGVLLG